MANLYAALKEEYPTLAFLLFRDIGTWECCSCCPHLISFKGGRGDCNLLGCEVEIISPKCPKEVWQRQAQTELLELLKNPILG